MFVLSVCFNACLRGIVVFMACFLWYLYRGLFVGFISLLIIVVLRVCGWYVLLNVGLLHVNCFWLLYFVALRVICFGLLCCVVLH